MVALQSVSPRSLFFAIGLALLSGAEGAIDDESVAALQSYLADRDQAVANPTDLNQCALVDSCLALLDVSDPPKGTPDPATLLAEAIAATRRVHDQETRSRPVLFIAEWYYIHGQLHEANEWLKTSLEELDRVKYMRPYLLLFSAQIARRTEGWLRANEILVRAEQALLDENPAYAKTLGAYHSSWRTMIYGERAQIWTELGVWEEARKWLDLEQSRADQSGEPDARANCFLHRADYWLALHRAKEAEDAIVDFLGTVEQSALTTRYETLLRGYREFAALQQSQEDHTDSTDTEQRLLHIAANPDVDTRTRVTFLLEVADAQLRRNALDEVREVLSIASNALGEASGSPHARGLLEAHRSRLLLAEGADVTSLRAQKGRLQTEYDNLLAQWANTPIREGSIGFLHLGTRRLILSELIRLTRATESDPRSGETEAFELLLRAEAMGSNARSRLAEPLVATDCRALLATPTSGILAFLVSIYRSHIFAVDGNDILHFELPYGYEVADLGRQLEKELSARRPLSEEASSSQRSKLIDLSQRLKQKLIPAELEARLATWSTVTIVGIDQLNYPSLECLPFGDRQLMGQCLAVDYVASLSELHALQSGGTTPFTEPQPLALIVAAKPTYSTPLSPPFDPIPFDSSTANRLGRYFGEGGYSLLMDATATPESWPANIADSPIVQFVLHGAQDRLKERGAGLVFEGDGSSSDVLYCDDVEKRLHARGLVLLTSCGAARGPRRIGDDRLTHLGGAFLNAGARAVILTRGELGFEPAMRLTDEFYRYLAAGSSPAEALTKARTRGDGIQAFYDARVQVVGLGQYPILPPGPLAAATSSSRASPWRWIIGLVAISLMTLVYVRRARSNS